MRIAMVGFGNVGKAFAELLREKRRELTKLGIRPVITGICTRRQGGFIRREGINLARAAQLLGRGGELTRLDADARTASTLEFVRSCPADVLIEISTLDYRDGEPAASHIKAALTAGMHVVTANKGPIACAYDRLYRLARRKGLQFRFEGSVLDGLPVFNLVERTLPCTDILGFRGIINSTTNYVLTEMQQGGSLEEALRKAQALGIAEADPSTDLLGWDAAAKVAALANVWLRAGITPRQVHRRGIERLTAAHVQEAEEQGFRIRLVGGADRTARGIRAYVRPEHFPLGHPFAQINGFSNILEIDTDTMNTITIVEANPGIRQTAYALLSDLVAVHQSLPRA